MARITERDVGLAVLRILAARPNGEAEVEAIMAELPKHITLSADDQADSETRSHEELWEQQVRNLKSHDKINGNVFKEGYVEIVSRGVWRITAAGRLHITATA